MRLPEEYIRELEQEDADHAASLSRFKKEPIAGHWTVSVDGYKVYIYNDDFTIDAMLTVGGDFADIDYKKAYAQKIANILNRHPNEI